MNNDARARHREAVRLYDSANTKKTTFKFNLNTDSDILARLDAVPNKAGYIKALIRQDIGGTK